MAYFNAMELRAISQVETDDIFLPRFMKAKMQLSEPGSVRSFWRRRF